jgi:hypothetical protein
MCVTLLNVTIMYNGLTLFSARGSFASLDGNGDCGAIAALGVEGQVAGV